MKTKIIGFLSFLMFAICIKLVAAPLDPGEKIFSSRCMACHKINADFAGPALAGVDKRHSIDWIIKFVHSSQTVIKSGDTSAMALFKKFNGIVMPDHPDLSNDDIKSVVAFIKDESMKVTTPEKKPLDALPVSAKLSAFKCAKRWLFTFPCKHNSACVGSALCSEGKTSRKEYA